MDTHTVSFFISTQNTSLMSKKNEILIYFLENTTPLLL